MKRLSCAALAMCSPARSSSVTARQSSPHRRSRIDVRRRKLLMCSDWSSSTSSVRKLAMALWSPRTRSSRLPLCSEAVASRLRLSPAGQPSVAACSRSRPEESSSRPRSFISESISRRSNARSDGPYSEMLPKARSRPRGRGGSVLEAMQICAPSGSWSSSVASSRQQVSSCSRWPSSSTRRNGGAATTAAASAGKMWSSIRGVRRDRRSRTSGSRPVMSPSASAT